MSKNIATMSDAEVFAVLDEYAERSRTGLVDFNNKVEMPTEELVFLSVALAYVGKTDEQKMTSAYYGLLKFVEGEMSDRALL